MGSRSLLLRLRQDVRGRGPRTRRIRIAFKCTPENFGELIERPGIIPAPYMARNMWVQEEQLGEALDRRELEQLLKTSYELVVAQTAEVAAAGSRSESG